MTTTSYMPARPRPHNGVLLLFLQMPLAAVVGGYLLDVVSLPVASFAVFVSSAAFPAWVSHRTAVSGDHREPVHHLHRYAVVAVGLVTVCTVAMAAASAVTGVGSSGLWRGLGAELTGEPLERVLGTARRSGGLHAGCHLLRDQRAGAVRSRPRSGGPASFGGPTTSATPSRRSSATVGGIARGTMDPAACAFDVPAIVEGVVAVSGASQSPTRDVGA